MSSLVVRIHSTLNNVDSIVTVHAMHNKPIRAIYQSGSETSSLDIEAQASAELVGQGPALSTQVDK